MPAITKTAICNMALSLINARTINSFDESIREARLCRTFYDQVRRTVLSDFDWNFARVELTLAEVDADDYSGWTYAYSYPTNCVPDGFRKIYRTEPTGDKIKFEVRASSDLTKNIILTDEAEAVGIYTADIDTTGRFSPQFINALVLSLASILAAPLKAKQSKVNELTQKYAIQLAHAKSLSANEQAAKDENYNSYKAARA